MFEYRKLKRTPLSELSDRKIKVKTFKDKIEGVTLIIAFDLTSHEHFLIGCEQQAVEGHTNSRRGTQIEHL